MSDSSFEGLSPNQQKQLTLVLDEYMRSLEDGRPLDRAEIVSRHPDLAGPIESYIESLNALQIAATGFAPSDDAGDSRGDQIGDFRIGRQLGRGGMGIVYEAEQLSLDRRVALKVLPFAALLDARQIARFRNEAQAAAQLHHANIVPVFAVGVDRGVHYYAMQLIDGQPLDQWISDRQVVGRDGQRSDQNSRTYKEVAQIVAQAADALHAAHTVGIIHRDIKPSNLLLDGDGKLWMTDFGLARCRSDSNLTRTGDVVGTINYMSPEQIQGTGHLVDHRTDIYSLGVTLFELLTLHPAVQGSTPAELVRALDRDEPLRPRRLNSNIPFDLECIVGKATARCRDERYESANALAEDLRRFLEGKPTVAKPPKLLDRVVKWSHRRRRTVATSVTMILFVAIGLLISNVLLARQKTQTEAALSEARKNFRQYRAQLAISHNRLALLQDQGGDTGSAEASFLASIRLQRAILADHPNDKAVLGKLAVALANLSFFYSKNKPQLAEDTLGETLRIQHRLVDSSANNRRYHIDLALTYSNIGSIRRRQGELKLAVSSYRRAIAMFQEVMETRRSRRICRDLAVCLNNLGTALAAQQQFAEAEKTFRSALQVLDVEASQDKAPATDCSTVGGIYNNLGRVLEGLRRLGPAEKSYSQAIQFQTLAVRRAPQVRKFRAFLKKHNDNHRRVTQRLAYSIGSRPDA